MNLFILACQNMTSPNSIVITLPTLYKLTKTGASQQWIIWTVGNEIHTSWGQVGGAQQSTVDVITSGKNTGRANASTPEEQAQLEAQAQWDKKLKKGYVQSLKAAQAGEVDLIIEGGIEPMLAKTWENVKKKWIWPSFAQIKLDGHRVIAVVKCGKCELWSRSRKRITGIPHIIKAVESWAEYYKLTDVILDGESYCDRDTAIFEKLTGFLTTEKPKIGHEIIQYHVYDVVLPGESYEARLAFLQARPFEEIAVNCNPSPIKRVLTDVVHSELDVCNLHKKYVEMGYEGLMLRSMTGHYEHKRSSNLIKVKQWQDAEFICTGVVEGRGKLAGHAIFECQVGDGPSKTFTCKMVGPTENLKKFWHDPSLAIGKKITVKFFEWTADGYPRFPTALRVYTEV